MYYLIFISHHKLLLYTFELELRPPRPVLSRNHPINCGVLLCQNRHATPLPCMIDMRDTDRISFNRYFQDNNRRLPLVRTDRPHQYPDIREHNSVVSQICLVKSVNAEMLFTVAVDL